MKAKKVEESQAIMTEMIMPNDTNPLGNLMGGNLMRWMDIAGAICANRHAEAFCVTASVDHISFHQPIRLGQVLTLEARVTRAFNTSMEIFVEAFVSDTRSVERVLANHAYFSFVALDEVSQKPRPVPQVIAQSEQEKELYDSALARREMRLLLSGRLAGNEAKMLRAMLDRGQLEL
jgi:acyl-CoA hydrolase